MEGGCGTTEHPSSDVHAVRLDDGNSMRRIRRPFTLRAALVAALVAAATVAPMGAQPASAGPIGVSGTINLTGHYVLVFRDWNINADRGTEVNP